jgi:hypothetical protein
LFEQEKKEKLAHTQKKIKDGQKMFQAQKTLLG